MSLVFMLCTVYFKCLQRILQLRLREFRTDAQNCTNNICGKRSLIKRKVLIKELFLIKEFLIKEFF